MNAPASPRVVAAPSQGDDERTLLLGLESLLAREEALLASRDAAALAGLAEERDRLTERLVVAARARYAARTLDAAGEAELLSLYERLRQRHAVQAQVVRTHQDRNARAVGVLAQATGHDSLYQADGRVAMKFVSV